MEEANAVFLNASLELDIWGRLRYVQLFSKFGPRLQAFDSEFGSMGVRNTLISPSGS